MATEHIPELDEIFERLRRRFNEGMADIHRDCEVLGAAINRSDDPREIAEAVESDRVLRKLSDDATAM